MTTDAEWEKWGARDPYFGVLTDPKFRADALTAEARDEFFALGRMHADYVLQVARARLVANFTPRRVLDFGCGVGRVAIPFAAVATEVVGVDVASSMLAEAQRNCDLFGVRNATFVISDDQLSRVLGDFDLVHSCIVIQHVEVPRGLQIFRQLLRRLAPGGVGAIHVTFGWNIHEATYGVGPPAEPMRQENWYRRLRREVSRNIRGLPPPTIQSSDPEMQMNFYNLSQLMYLLHHAGIGMVHSELTDHGGALGAFMFFRAPA